jgi:hypothetical protein
MGSLAIGKPERFENRSDFPWLQTQLLARAPQEIIDGVCQMEGLNRDKAFLKVNHREKGPKDSVLFHAQGVLRNGFAGFEELQQHLSPFVILRMCGASDLDWLNELVD